MTQVYTQPFIPPLHERPSLHEQTQHQYNPRTIPSPRRHQFYNSEDPYAGNDRKDIGSRSTMHKLQQNMYDIEATKAGDMYPARTENIPKPPREQLPPLSSLLFGSSAPPPRPPPSTYSDGHSPVFSSTSPHDRHLTTPIHGDRPYEGSYFQRPPVARQYSYTSRLDQVDRLGIPPPPRPAQTGPPESPRYDSQYVSRHQGPPSLNGWGGQPARVDYFPRDTSSSFRTQPDHHQAPPAHRIETDRLVYREAAHSAPPTPTYPPTPGSTVSGEPTTKDGLGPKIWTGTQFLPRFVRQAEVTGEGMCYFYDDGTHCKTVIDGEMVNAHWGVTKAGKPRKRLAIACITCREKKIKCDPDYPRCVQCEKFGRICKFKNAPRGGQGSPDTPPADPEDRPISSRADLDGFQVEKRESSLSVSPRQALRQATPDSETHHTKRQRNGYNDFTPVASEASPRVAFQETTPISTHWAQHSNASSAEHINLIRDWHTNPFSAQSALVSELIDVFFKHVPETAYSMFPESVFKPWVLSNFEKSPDDLMVIYTVLAIGTVFSLKAEHKPFGTQFAAISRYGCDNRPFTIQLVQSRVLLSLYYFANDAAEDSWDYCGAALRAASGLKLNIEMEKSEDAFRTTYPFGLTRAGYAECRRRTFWSCYVMDRFNGFCTGHISIIHPEDIFLRLPSDSKSFEAQTDVQNPYFDVSMTTVPNKNWTVGSLSYLINISTIWGDVMANIYRATQSPHPIPSYTWQTLHDSADRRLQAWKDSLPSYYTFSAENLARAANKSKLGTFMTMHAVYHATMMKLHRYIQVSTLSNAKLAHHVSIAEKHAELLLSTMDTLAAHRNDSPPASPTNQRDMRMRFSSPFVGFAVVSAIDILSAKLPPASVPHRLASFGGAESVIGELATFWQCSKNQHAQVRQRMNDWTEISKSVGEAGGASTVAFRFGQYGSLVRESAEGLLAFREPIEKTYPREFDCVYA